VGKVNKLRLIFIESFIPVLMIVMTIALILVYVNYKAVSNSDQTLVINIPENVQVSNIELSSEFGAAIISDKDSDSKLDPKQEQAYLLMADKKWVAAENLLKEIFLEHKSSKALNDLGVLYYQQNKLEKAIIQYNLALKVKPIYLNTYINRGLIKSKLGQYEAAINDYMVVLDQIPYHFQANLNVGVGYIKLKLYKKAVLKLKTASELSGGKRKAKALYNLGIAYKNIGVGKHNVARRVLAHAIRIKPGYIEARFAIASLESKTDAGRIRALQQYEKVLDLQPKYPPAYFRIASVHSEAKNYKLAQKNYLTAVTIDPNYTKARYNLALSYLKTKNWQAANDHFEQLLQQDSDTAKIHFQLGRIAYGRKNYAQALLAYQKALDLKDQRYAKAQLNIGLTYKKLKKYNKALVAYKNAIDLKSNYHQAWYNMGLAHLRTKNYTVANTAFSTAIRYNPIYAQAWFSLGVTLSKQKKYDDAINAYKKAIDLKPHYHKANLNLAVRYAKLQRYDDAIETYTIIIKEDKTYTPAWTNRGIAFYKQNNYSQAKINLRTALSLDSENIVARRFLAKLAIRDDDYADAISLLTEAVNRKTNSAIMRFELSLAYRQSGEIDRANSELAKAQKLQPDNKRYLSK